MDVCRRRLTVSRLVACQIALALSLAGVLTWRDTRLDRGAREGSRFSRNLRVDLWGPPVSLVFDKRSHADGAPIDSILRWKLPGKKFVTCPTPDRAPAPLGMLNLTLAGGFDVFDCEVRADWAGRQVIERLANSRVAWVTLVRDPFDALMSHYERYLKSWNGGDVANCADIAADQVSAFYRRVYGQYLLEEFGSLQALRDEISSGRICSRWDVVLEAETVADDVENFLGVELFPRREATAPACGGVTDQEAVVIKAQLREEYAHHRALLACKETNKQLRLIEGNAVLSR